MTALRRIERLVEQRSAAVFVGFGREQDRDDRSSGIEPQEPVTMLEVFDAPSPAQAAPPTTAAEIELRPERICIGLRNSLFTSNRTAQPTQSSWANMACARAMPAWVASSAFDVRAAVTLELLHSQV